MSKIQDIINAAGKKNWVWLWKGKGRFIGELGVVNDPDLICTDINEEGYTIVAQTHDSAASEFIATFDPEHIALMEKALLAAHSLWHTRPYKCEPVEELITYRLERGLIE